MLSAANRLVAVEESSKPPIFSGAIFRGARSGSQGEMVRTHHIGCGSVSTSFSPFVNTSRLTIKLQNGLIWMDFWCSSWYFVQ